ncbi:MAG: VWA domain-containing protein [Candidatus Riflebacteria bacterium]|nr:VWA domain-containing protein [Candidatus Riflebacteria bacterium]
MGQWLLRFLVDRRIDTGDSRDRQQHNHSDHSDTMGHEAQPVSSPSLPPSRRERQLRARPGPELKRTMIAARLVTLLLLFCLMLRPALRCSRVRTPIVTVLLDASASMAHGDVSAGEACERAAAFRLGLVPSSPAADPAARAKARSATRWEIARALVDQPVTGLKARLGGPTGELVEVRVLEFGSRLRESTGATRPGDPRTDLAGALDALDKQLVAAPWLAAIVLTDGNANCGDEPRRSGERYGDRGVPIHAVGLGAAQQRRDIQVAEVGAPEFAFVGCESPVRSRGAQLPDDPGRARPYRDGSRLIRDRLARRSGKRPRRRDHPWHSSR